MPSPLDPALNISHDVDLDVHGAVPPGLSGRVIAIDRDGVVHSVQLCDGRVSYRGWRFQTDTVLHHVVAFSGSILAFGDDSLAYELSAELDTLSPVDLAGQRRSPAAYPKLDPTTGELHLIAAAPEGTQAHVVISAGALTRRSQPILDRPNRVCDLALTSDHVLMLADGFVGLTSRHGEAHTTWISTDVSAPHPVHAHDAGDSVELLALTPSIERWTIRTGGASVQREVLDPTPRRFAHCASNGIDETARVLWTTGDTTVGHHDLAASRHTYRNLWHHVPGDLIFVPDPTRADDTDGGWLVGFVHDPSGASEFRVIDSAAIARPAVADAAIKRRIPRDLRCTWIPSIQP